MIGAGLAEAGASARARHEMIRSRTSGASVRDEPLAQLAEHLTFNQGVGGSIPPRLTIHFGSSPTQSQHFARFLHPSKRAATSASDCTLSHWISSSARVST